MKIITKSHAAAMKANLSDYDDFCSKFHWEGAYDLLEGLPNGGLNIAHEAIDRHVAHGLGEKTAICWLSKGDSRREISYAELKDETNRFANVLAALGVHKGEKVFTLLGRVPELYIAALGTLKLGAVFCPMFSAFGPEPVKARMTIGEARVLVTSKTLYKRKIASWRTELPELEHILLIDSEDHSGEGTESLGPLMAAASTDFSIIRTEPEDMALLHFTSGTTGRPKGAVHVHMAVVAHNMTGRLALDLKAGDTFWCTADPGWVTGTSYGIIAPLTNATTMIVDEADFDAERWYRILQNERVNVWYTAPTAIRMLMKAGAELTKGYDFSQLRFMASVGEPLNPEAVIWGNNTFGMPFHDNWWQTETGGIMIANYASMDVKPGSMGKPLPGITAAIVKTSGDTATEITKPMTIGQLVLKPGWPSMIRAYLHEAERYRKCFVGDWYISGDLAMRDTDGYFWFVGRDDDVIKSAGHLIGPFEVESALMEHPAIAEAGVIGVPDETTGEMVKAYVALNPGFEENDALMLSLVGHARKRLGPAVAPKEIVFRKNLPKTRSGKIMRRLLKARELDLPEGDISTLESDEQ
ncbi:acetate--CoA ligase [Cohaesibacter celericrescens]|uniref:acetate--CoA ligase n=1 Tax=Cohaesibacter celericrescens TaxID=2067669 RepID=A0A2N5XVI5_9HYPH|nr:acetate--CoA ligase [Cohaesibacter celericrescens]PLW78477.1 acetate--CoA ligase [Cohaesibacter celericrescens]